MATLSAHALQFSGNTLDKYHCLGSAQLPGAPRLQYLTLCLNGTSPSSKYDILVTPPQSCRRPLNYTQTLLFYSSNDDLYSWRISLWSSATLRISRDLYLGIGELDSLNVFELLNAAQDQRSDDAFLYVDIIHR